MPVTLILGGARSGKSRRAEAIACEQSDAPVYIATAPLIDNDHEWLARIECHRAERGKQWRVIEETLALADVLQQEAVTNAVLLVDCMTLWLCNLGYAGKDIEAATAELCELLPKLEGEVIMVANEVGMGLVPENAEGRAFRDAQGRLNQSLAAAADRVEFIAAGLPICLKDCRQQGEQSA